MGVLQQAQAALGNRALLKGAHWAGINDTGILVRLQGSGRRHQAGVTCIGYITGYQAAWHNTSSPFLM
jgi:hypothetical protein